MGKTYMESIKKLFSDIDSDHSGVITIEEFEGYLKHDQSRAYLESLDIEPTDAWTLFKLLDADEEGSIDIDEFVRGCLNLKGAAKAVHIAKMEHDNKKMRLVLDSFMESVDIQLDALVTWAGLDPLAAYPKTKGAAK